MLIGIHNRLRTVVRAQMGQRSRPTAAILDSPTVRSAGWRDESGYDGARKTKVRKRFLLTNTEGHVLAVAFVPASVPEREGGKGLLDEVLAQPIWLQLLSVDVGFSGPEFAGYVAALNPGLEVEVIKRSDKAQAFGVVPRRWVVERTFGWLMQHRRFVLDYERRAESFVAWIQLVMTRIMLRRLA